MPVVPEDQRLDVLRCVGLSEPLLRLSAGVSVDPLFGHGGIRGEKALTTSR
jgi:hypothetical protein